MGQFSKIEDNALWEALSQYQGEQFTTSGRGSAPGKQLSRPAKNENAMSRIEKHVLCRKEGAVRH